MSDVTNAIGWLSTHLKALIDHGSWLEQVGSLENYERELKDRIESISSSIIGKNKELDDIKSEFEQTKSEMSSYVEGAKKEAQALLDSAKATEASLIAQATQVAEDIKEAAEQASKSILDAIADKTTEYNALLQSIADKQKVEAEVQARLDALKKMF